MSTYRNTVTLKGFLGRDAELHINTNQTPFAVLSLATKSTHRNKQSGEFVSHTEWHRVIANGRLAESAKSLLKGAHVEVQGRLQSYRYEDNAGVQRRVWEVRAHAVTHLERAAGDDRENLDASPSEEDLSG
jgi:single-strand DNA-binding protein